MAGSNPWQDTEPQTASQYERVWVNVNVSKKCTWSGQKTEKALLNGLASLYKCLHSSLLNRLSYRDYSCSRSVSKRLRLFSLANKCLICVLKCVFTELVIQNVSVNVRNQLKKFPGDV